MRTNHSKLNIPDRMVYWLKVFSIMTNLDVQNISLQPVRLVQRPKIIHSAVMCFKLHKLASKIKFTPVQNQPKMKWTYSLKGHWNYPKRHININWKWDKTGFTFLSILFVTLTSTIHSRKPRSQSTDTLWNALYWRSCKHCNSYQINKNTKWSQLPFNSTASFTNMSWGKEWPISTLNSRFPYFIAGTHTHTHKTELLPCGFTYDIPGMIIIFCQA